MTRAMLLAVALLAPPTAIPRLPKRSPTARRSTHPGRAGAHSRAGDVHFILDELSRRPREGACGLHRVDLDRIGMSGHSFGARTTQAIAGQRLPVAGITADPRVKAAIAFSPTPPMRGGDTAAFGAIALPFFSITGTEDAAPNTPNIKPEDRERPFRAMPPGGKYLLVLDGANHMVFNAQDGLRGPASTASPHIPDSVIRRPPCSGAQGFSATGPLEQHLYDLEQPCRLRTGLSGNSSLADVTDPSDRFAP